MRILYIGNINNPHEKKWVVPISEKGHEVHIISPESSDNIGKVEVHLYDPDELYKESNSLVRFINKVKDMRSFIDYLRPDIVHFQFVVDLAFTAPYLGFKHVFLTPWGSDILIFPERSRKIRWLLKRTLNKAKVLTIHSTQILDKIGSMVDISQKKIERVAYSVDSRFQENINEKEIEDIKAKYGITDEHKVILSFRNIMEVYNLEEIIMAMAKVVKTNPNIKFIILYEYNIPERVDYIKNYVNEKGLGSHTIFINNVPNEKMFNFYTLADVGISFSKSDGCPVSVLEAIASRLPLAVSDIAANRQILREESASYANVGDISRLAHNIDKLLNDEQFNKRQVDEAYQDLMKIGFNEDNVEQLNDLYLDYYESEIKK